MAIGIVQNGVTLGGFHPLGSVSVRSGVQVPSQYWATNLRYVSGGSGQPFDYQRMLRVRAQTPDPGYSNTPRTCDEADGLPCMDGRVNSSLSGLRGFGDVSNFICSDWAKVMTEMQVLLATAEERGTSTSAYAAAKEYYDGNTGVFQKPILSCGSHTATAKQLYTALNADLGNIGPPVSDTIKPPAPGQSDGDKILTAVKYGAIAVAVLAGAYALGPIFRGIGGLIPKGK